MTQPPASHHAAGAYVEAPPGGAFETRYPATGEPIAGLHAATPALIERAVGAAAEGFAFWRAWPPAARGSVLRRAADIIRTRSRELSEMETLDTGEPSAVARSVFSIASRNAPPPSISAILWTRALRWAP